MTEIDLAVLIRDVPDFPTEGILFKDVMPLIADPARRSARRSTGSRRGRGRGRRILILGAEARGFIFGGALAYALGCGFVTARKPGKLPWTDDRSPVRPRVRQGLRSRCTPTRSLVAPGSLVLDDVLATGGTAAAQGRPRRATGWTGRRGTFRDRIVVSERPDRLPGVDVHALIDFS